MTTAFAYARVSTPDQEHEGNSIPEQFTRIKKYARENRIQIVEEFQDSSSAYNDEDRPGFDQMLNEAIQKHPKFILVDDSSRFARTRRRASTTKYLLQEHGVRVIAVSEPYIDPKSVQALWVEGIAEIKNEATSHEIAFHTIRGMNGNIKARDPETGWCYKNGGRTPYGYRPVRVNRGQDSKGKPIIKTIWELDPEKAPIAKMIIVDLYLEKAMPYEAIRDHLNKKAIP
ncbi:MAG: recombinase family protein, partial [Bacillota bacterium]